MRKKILILDHHPQQHPSYEDLGINSSSLQTAMNNLHIFSNRLFDEDTSATFLRPSDIDPQELQDHLRRKFDLVIGSGSPFNIHPDDINKNSWIKHEMTALREFSKKGEGKYYGVCFGHQIWNEALGGKISPTKRYYRGTSTFTETESGKQHIAYRSHGHHVATPAPNMTVVGVSSENGDPNQEMIYSTASSNAFTLQTHPEKPVNREGSDNNIIQHVRNHLFRDIQF